MEIPSIIILVIVLIFLMKNEKGRKVVDHFGNTAVHIAASADKASAALERQCDELLSDKEAEALKAEVMADMVAEAKATKPKVKASKKAKAIVEDLDDYSDAI